jgi:hypothetical protein
LAETPFSLLEEDFIDPRGSGRRWRQLAHANIDFVPAAGGLGGLRLGGGNLVTPRIRGLACCRDACIRIPERRPRGIEVFSGNGG